MSNVQRVSIDGRKASDWKSHRRCEVVDMFLKLSSAKCTTISRNPRIDQRWWRYSLFIGSTCLLALGNKVKYNGKIAPAKKTATVGA